MPIQSHKNHSLAKYNTFGVSALAREFIEVHSGDQLLEAVAGLEASPWILGGGSNILLLGDVERTVLHNCIGGLEVVEQNDRYSVVGVGGGVNWHEFVLWSVDHRLGGVENLALIPGRAGAAPIQNIGAYGVELRDVFEKLEAVDLETGKMVEFGPDECEFGYRNSVFKHIHKGRYCISRIYVRLYSRDYQVNTSYGAIEATLTNAGVMEPGIRDVCNAVIEIRSAKLPDPVMIGNAGSFFKNPIIPDSQWEALISEFPDMVYYPDASGFYKIPAGWLIDQCGWKGKREGNVGCYSEQALVIVNYGGASGHEIFDFAMRVRESVIRQFGIELEPEVNIIGS